MTTKARAKVVTASTKVVGDQESVVRSTQVNRCSVVTKNKPKMLTGLDQKVSGQAGLLYTQLTQMTSHRRRGGT